MLRNKLPYTSWLQTTHTLISSQFLSPGWLSWVLHLGSHKATLKVSAGLCFHLKPPLQENPLPTHSGCWQNSFPYRYRTEVPGFCWLSAQVLEVTCSSLPHGLPQQGFSLHQTIKDNLCSSCWQDNTLCVCVYIYICIYSDIIVQCIS